MSNGEDPSTQPVGDARGSPWLEGDPGPQWPRVDRDRSVEIAVVGAGIVGVTAAWRLAAEGADVALIDATRLGSGVTGHTTAKLTSLHGLSYASLWRRVGEEAARAYGEANEDGIATVAGLVDGRGIDCDFRRKPSFTYTERAGKVGEIEAEVEAARRLGLPASYEEGTDLPFPVAAAVRFGNQAEFHPQRYLLALARAAEEADAAIYERSRAVELRGTALRLENGAVLSAERVIVATHSPFPDRGLYFARTHPERSYGIGLRVEERPPQGMYLSAESPIRSIRSHPLADGELLIVGGESHRPGSGDEPERYRSLERWARERWEVAAIRYRWSAQDNVPADGLPYVGKLWPPSDRVLCATGFKKWGLAMGTTAGGMLAEQALGRRTEWSEVFGTDRLNLRASARELVTHNAVSGVHFFADRLTQRGGGGDLARGEGRIVRSGVGQAALYRDDAGELHRLSARCTHLGCIVRWNGAERSFDCPCHGSRFDAATGEVLHGPAVSPLKRKAAT